MTIDTEITEVQVKSDEVEREIADVEEDIVKANNEMREIKEVLKTDYTPKSKQEKVSKREAKKMELISEPQSKSCFINFFIPCKPSKDRVVLDKIAKGPSSQSLIFRDESESSALDGYRRGSMVTKESFGNINASSQEAYKYKNKQKKRRRKSKI